MNPWDINRTNRPTAGIDIDGVLNYYPIPWVDFVNKAMKSQFSRLDEIKAVLDYYTYKKLKAIWRTSDEKLAQKARKGAKQFLKSLRLLGYRVVLISKRPVDEVPELRTLTIDWLRINNLIYDDIIFSKKKHLMLIDQFPELSFMVEDHREIANQVGQFGFRVFLVNSPYNQMTTVPQVCRVDSLSEIIQILEAENEGKPV